ncbi:hypothetical protein NPIL_493181 [Nephila pilipes]|uniref:Uncharacterized protein n=1 Tax=Nephila pilipes TaxID=299642 RepID=A0A8X6QXB3_NEPPI|nr:hypothetical protein NPIL_493181 [Nephila pilipes]
MKETVLQRFTDSPTTSTQAVAAELDVPHTVVWNVLYTSEIYPYHIHKAIVLFTDVTSFSRDGIVNTYNAHLRTVEILTEV